MKSVDDSEWFEKLRKVISGAWFIKHPKWGGGPRIPLDMGLEVEDVT